MRDVSDGVDESLAGLFWQDGEATWSKVVLTRDATCRGCARGLAAGSEAWVSLGASGESFRCEVCGGPVRPPRLGKWPLE